MIVNPFTRQVINENTEGHNQYWNPDGTVRPTASGKMTRFRKLLQRLNSSAEKAGTGLFGPNTEDTDDPYGQGLSKSKLLNSIKRMGLRDRINEDRNNQGMESTIDDFEYIFKPSTGEGIDASGESLKNPPKSWYDSDGRIYTYSAADDGVIVLDPKKRGIKGVYLDPQKGGKRKVAAEPPIKLRKNWKQFEED